MNNFLKSKTIQGAILGILGAILVTFLTLTFPYWNPFSKLSETQSYYFAPGYNQSLNSSKLLNVECWTGSISVNRSDAFRCIADNHEIHDPCFVNEIQNSLVVCPLNPYGSNEYFVTDYSKLPKNFNGLDNKDDKHPWFIKLEDNTECEFMTGVTMGVADMRLDYGCGTGKYNGLLLPITSDDKLQSIGCYIGDKITNCKIKEVWY